MRVAQVLVPSVVQETDYTCGPASLRAVLKHYGIRKTEKVLAREMGADPINGTTPDDIVRVAGQYGLKATKIVRLGKYRLREYLAKGFPVIIAIQAWAERAKPNYKNTDDNGHYVVATGYDRYGIKIIDPVMPEPTRISYRRLAQRWHDRDGDGERYYQLGIVMEKK
jgi:ABC-type bacteriocin/lantibiotic exporter with double-glycine peptidase domain